MHERGFDPSVIAPLEERCRRAEAVRNQIRTAFAGVTLGSGVGLFQGQALDDYADEARQAQARARARDEKQDWSTIPAGDLNACNSSLSFFDSEGMRFHLPAFLLAELDGTFDFSLCFHLAYSTDPASRFSALNQQQRKAVRAFLFLIRDEPDMAIERDHIDRALNAFWSAESLPGSA